MRFERQDGRKAPGVDGVGKDDYAAGLDARREDLSARIRRPGYRPLPVRRTDIPKGDGRYRPPGVPSFEDRLVQDRLGRILQAIWEPEFRDCSLVITSRLLLLGAPARLSRHGAQTRLTISDPHVEAAWVEATWRDIAAFFKTRRRTAEQFNPLHCRYRLLARRRSTSTAANCSRRPRGRPRRRRRTAAMCPRLRAGNGPRWTSTALFR
jgi:hypothetical protein